MDIDPNILDQYTAKKKEQSELKELTNYYYVLRGWDKYPKEFWVKHGKEPKYSYPRNIREAKQLLLYCEGDVKAAANELYLESQRSKQNGDFDWRISTIFRKWIKQEEKRSKNIIEQNKHV